jgi:hypothetical protein
MEPCLKGRDENPTQPVIPVQAEIYFNFSLTALSQKCFPDPAFYPAILSGRSFSED